MPFIQGFFLEATKIKRGWEPGGGRASQQVGQKISSAGGVQLTHLKGLQLQPETVVLRSHMHSSEIFCAGQFCREGRWCWCFLLLNQQEAFHISSVEKPSEGTCQVLLSPTGNGRVQTASVHHRNSPHWGLEASPFFFFQVANIFNGRKNLQCDCHHKTLYTYKMMDDELNPKLLEVYCK